MPVPVPLVSKPPAHQVRKLRSHSGAQHPSIHTLTHSLPHPPPGPPPSYGTREEWISSLPDWRRNKPRRIWEEDDSTMLGFRTGLTNAENAFVIKGQRAQACRPPQIALIDPRSAPVPNPLNAHHGMMGDNDAFDPSFEFDVESQWSAHSPRSDENTMEVDDGYRHIANHVAAAYPATDAVTAHYDRGAFSPIFEASSPDHDDRPEPGSSPLGPVTPFGEFVDRAVATVGYDRNPFPSVHVAALPAYVSKADPSYTLPPFELPEEPAPAPAPAPEAASVPSSTVAYKKVADPLADWMAMYVWKTCTVGQSLPQKYMPRSGPHEQRYSPLPPPYLASAIRSLFMSTLLQPSAILLAVWYIVRLPVCFGSMAQRASSVEETYFRTEVLGMNEWRGISERDAVEMDSAFRLVLLGCMLANKWLDDHTFSNKTWHAISGVPIQSLNRLEVYALSIFGHDLSVPTDAWMQWLEHVLAHHAASSPIGPPQPISRPSSDPRVIVRRTVEQLIDCSLQCATRRPCGDPCCQLSHVEPVFFNQEERKSRVEQLAVELEIDLDEDGPLREEYMPKRRISRAGSDRPAMHGDEWALERTLPPPAKWSPSADEPLARGANDRNRQYVAVQAPAVAPHAPLLQPTRLYATWGATMPPVVPQQKVQLPPIYPPPSYQHLRSASLPGVQEPQALHSRSQSQQFGYACSDMRATAGNQTYQESYWPVGLGATADPYHRSSGHGFNSFDAMQFPPSSWIRV